ncbi:MAG: ankyrin repeat domain-containing protein, partial [Nitrospinota bacterium]
LLRAGFDVNSKTNSGRTPLMFAALRGHVESVKILLKFQADVSLRAQYGETALDHALSGYHFAKRKNRWELLTPGMPFAEVQEIIGIVPEPKGLYTVKRTVVETDSGKYVFQYGKLVEWLINKFTNAVVSEERQLQAFEEIIELLQKTEEAFHSE